jgi:hypothetical protein
MSSSMYRAFCTALTKPHELPVDSRESVNVRTTYWYPSVLYCTISEALEFSHEKAERQCDLLNCKVPELQKV